MLDLIQFITQTRRQKLALGDDSKNLCFPPCLSQQCFTGGYPAELNLASNPSNAIEDKDFLPYPDIKQLFVGPRAVLHQL